MKRGLLLALIGLAWMIASALPANADNVSAYGAESCCMTASGEFFDGSAFTAAHNWYPFGTLLEVCLDGCVVVRVNDRSPSPTTYDISMAAAYAIGLAPNVGRCECKVTVLYMPSV